MPLLDLLSLALFSLNLLNLPQDERYTAAERQFQEDIQIQTHLFGKN